MEVLVFKIEFFEGTERKKNVCGKFCCLFGRFKKILCKIRILVKLFWAFFELILGHFLVDFVLNFSLFRGKCTKVLNHSIM